MTRTVFSDFDEFSNAVAGTTGQFIPTARSTNPWWVRNVAAGGVQIQTFQIGGRSTFAGDGKPNQITLRVPLSEPAASQCDGWPLHQASCLLIAAGQPFVLTTLAATQWVSLAIPVEHELLAPEHMKAKLSQLFDGKSDSRIIVNTEHLDRLRALAYRLSAAVGEGALDADCSCAQQEIVAAVSHLIAASSRPATKQVGRPCLARAQIISQVLALTDTRPLGPLPTDELCRRIGVAERTLRNICHEYFGVGPASFMKARQLRNIRAALLAADPARDTVTRIATRFGISDLSLFARNYKALFGESPSYSLRLATKRAQRALAVCDPRLSFATCDSSSQTVL